jgi:hypothetical protein
MSGRLASVVVVGLAIGVAPVAAAQDPPDPVDPPIGHVNPPAKPGDPAGAIPHVRLVRDSMRRVARRGARVRLRAPAAGSYQVVVRRAAGGRVSRVRTVTLDPGQVRTVRLHLRAFPHRLRPAARAVGTRHWTAGPAVRLR